VQFGDLLDDLASLRDAVGAGRGEREVPGRQVGHVRVVGSPVDPEQLPQLLEGGEVIAVRERAQAECVPGPRGDHPALLRVGAEGGQDEPVSMAGIPAGSLDRRDDKDAGRRGDVASRFVPGRGDQLKRVVPAPGVEVGPAERRQRAPADGANGAIGARVPRGLQEPDCVPGLVTQPGGCSGVVQASFAGHRRPDIAEESLCLWALVGDRERPGARRLRFAARCRGQQFEHVRDAVDAVWVAGLIGGGGGQAEGVPGSVGVGRRVLSCQREHGLRGADVASAPGQCPSGDVQAP
jgi:hypothetical protein